MLLRKRLLSDQNSHNGQLDWAVGGWGCPRFDKFYDGSSETETEPERDGEGSDKEDGEE